MSTRISFAYATIYVRDAGNREAAVEKALAVAEEQGLDGAEVYRAGVRRGPQAAAGRWCVTLLYRPRSDQRSVLIET